jgi:hypothetical protein
MPSASVPPPSELPSARRRSKWVIGSCLALAVLLCCLSTFLKIVVAYNPSLILSAQGTCRITQNQLEPARYSKLYHTWQTRADVTYILVTADGRTTWGENYDWLDDMIGAESSGEAKLLAARYQVNRTYPCWYNPSFPWFSALSRDADANRIPGPKHVAGGVPYGITYIVVALVGMALILLLSGFVLAALGTLIVGIFRSLRDRSPAAQ